MPDDGSDLAAAIQTIVEVGFDDLQRAVAEAFDGAEVSVAVHDGLFDLQLHQRGMLRPLRAAELSDCAPGGDAVEISLYEDLGETRVDGWGRLTAPPWDRGRR